MKTVVLDKTGTITEGKPKVTDIILIDSINKDNLLTIAASLEKLSEHPLADAIIEEGNRQNLTLKTVEKFDSIHGQGIIGKIDSKQYYAGNLALALMETQNVSTLDYQNISDQFADIADNGKTPLYFADESKLIGIIAVADVVKPTNIEAIAIKEFKHMGINVVKLIGITRKLLKQFAKKLVLILVIADVFPQDKEAEIRKIQNTGTVTAMVGDGINDAPAL